MIRFEHPEALLLAPLVAAVLWRHLVPRPLVGVLRGGLLLALAAVLAGPYTTGEDEGRDLVLVLDRSRSVPEGGRDRAAELAALAREHARAGDRIGLVVFGRDGAVEQAPREDFAWRPLVRAVDRDASDVQAGIETALSLIPPGRRGSILLVSDGEATGGEAEDAARAALRRGVRVDAVPLRRSGAFDLAVDEIAAPAEVAGGEPFQFSAWVRAERAAEVPVRLWRDGKVLAEGTRALRPGLNRLVFRDRIVAPGVHRYRVEVVAEEDRVQENNRARAVVRVGGPFRVLCVTPGGREDRLTAALRGAGIEVVVAAPGGAPLGDDALAGFRAVVLENVPAGALPHGALASLGRYVRHFGGGLLMTGGGASFGPGGYLETPVEEVLPVSMEVREEQRKFALAMAIALDRSGSMARPVPTGEAKMDLANAGAAAAVELLTAIDSVAVIAVDSSAHTVVEMQPVEDEGALVERIRSIESGGGGVYTYTALRAAAAQLADAPQTNRHIVLFADAADAEEPGDYRSFVPELRKAGVSVSVIGLGSDTDTDAAFLEDVAKRGGGRASFVSDPLDLPRVFAQETVQVARSSLVEEPAGVRPTAALAALGDLLGQDVPPVGGYSIAWRRDGAQVGMWTTDETPAPLLSFWQVGAGRSAAFLGEVDGRLTGAWREWEDAPGLLATVVRWTAGTRLDRLFGDLRREGHEAVLEVEVERGDEALLSGVKAVVVGPDGEPRELPLSPAGGRLLRARFDLEGEGVYRAALEVGDEGFLRVPPVILPYSPEFAPRPDPRAGEKLLARLTGIGRGRIDPPAADLLAGPRATRGVQHLATLFALLAVALLLTEIAVRRLGLHLPTGRAARVVERLRRVRAVRKPRREPGKEPTETGRAPGPPGKEDTPGPAAEEADLLSVLDRAKRRR